MRVWRVDTEGPPAASAGPWSLYAGTPRSGAGPAVTVWVLNKAALGGDGGGGGGGGQGQSPSPNPALATARRGVAALARLRHPALLRVIGPLEETRSQLVWVSEAVALTGADVLAGASAGAGGGQEAAPPPPPLSPLEVKAGCLALADGLSFLHSAAGLVHRAVGPDACMITAKGQWKLAGLGLAVPIGGGGGGGAGAGAPTSTPTPSAAALPPPPHGFDWHAPGPAGAACRPDAAYSSPEVVSSSPPAGPPADVFSLALLTHDLLAPATPALGRGRVSGGDPAGHAAAVAALTGTSAGLSSIPPDAAAALRPALAVDPAARPTLGSWTAATPWFAADGALATLRALDATADGAASASSSSATAALLMEVTAHLPAYDVRLRTLRLLPPLLAAAASDPALQAQALPLILTVAAAQGPAEFGAVTLPALKPLAATATGAGLAALARALPDLAAKCRSPGEVVSLLIPLASRALDGGGVGAPADAVGDPAVKAAAAQPADPKAQEDVLRAAGRLAGAGGPAAEAALLPRAHAAALRTTSAGVRAAALGALGDLCKRAPRPASVAALDTLRRVAAVDGSPSTTAAALRLTRALVAQWGPDLAAAAVLPALCPLLVSRALPPEGFEAVLSEVRSMLELVETARRGRRGGGGGGGAGVAAGSDSFAGVPAAAMATPAAPARPSPAGIDLLAGVSAAMTAPTPAPAVAALPPAPPARQTPPPVNPLFAGLATATAAPPSPRPPPAPVPALPPPPGRGTAPPAWGDLLSAGPPSAPASSQPPPGGDAFAALLAGPPPMRPAARQPPAPPPPPPRPAQPDSLI